MPKRQQKECLEVNSERENFKNSSHNNHQHNINSYNTDNYNINYNNNYNNNHSSNYNNNHNNNYSNNNNNANKSNNIKNNKKCNQKNDRSMVERFHNASETFNNECRADRVTCDASNSIQAGKNAFVRDINYIKTPNAEHEYENLKFDLNLSKSLLLQKFFHSTEKSSAIYENLCRGCGYGVFEARGNLCFFCECIVHGVQVRAPTTVTEIPTETSANIYENICEKCGSVYSDDECICSVSEVPIAYENWNNYNETKDATSSDKTADSAIVSDKSNPNKDIKLGKSKSFNKRDKLSLFHGFIGSLKRARTAVIPANETQAVNTRKRLEIVHNVDGYENVFRTQETFDLQRICQLKRNKQTSTSDQHIYGRLKSTPETPEEDDLNIEKVLPTQLSQSHDQLLQTATATVLSPIAASSVNSLDASAKQKIKNSKKYGRFVKRPRISKPRLLRTTSQSTESSTNTLNTSSSQNNTSSVGHNNTEKYSLYLSESVCNWMTSLRREIHNYHCLGTTLDDNIGLCTPKSIPAKNTLIYYTNGSGVNDDGILNNGAKYFNQAIIENNLVTNCQNIDNDKLEKFYSSDVVVGNSYSDVYCNNVNDKYHLSDDEIATLRKQNYSYLFEADEKAAYEEEEYQEENERQQQVYQRSPVAQMVYEFKCNLLARQMQQQKQQQQQHQHQIQQQQRRHAAVGVEQTTTRQQRAKRQAIYLKTDDLLNINNASNNNNNNNNNNGSDTENSSNSNNNINSHNNNNECKSHENSNNSKNNTNTQNSRKNIQKDNNNDANTNYLSKQMSNIKPTITNSSTTTTREIAQLSTASVSSKIPEFANTQLHAVDGEQGFTSRRAARQAITTSGRRCGIYERDSDFVNDILYAFDTFLQREIDEVATVESFDESQKNKCEQSKSQEVNNKIASDNANECVKQCDIAVSVDESALKEFSVLVPQFKNSTILASVYPSTVLSVNSWSLDAIVAIDTHTFNYLTLLSQLSLSVSLNRIVIFYDKPLREFLYCITQVSPYRVKCAQYSNARLQRLYKRFHTFCQQIAQKDNLAPLEDTKTPTTTITASPTTTIVKCTLVSKALSRVDGSLHTLVTAANVSASTELIDQNEINATLNVASVKKVPKCVDNPIVLKEIQSIEECCKTLGDSTSSSASVKEISSISEIDKTQIENKEQILEQQQPTKTSIIVPTSASVSLKTVNRPQVPARDPKTALTNTTNINQIPPRPVKRDSTNTQTAVNIAITPTTNSSTTPNTNNSINQKMTVPAANTNPTHNPNNGNAKKITNKNEADDDDGIYQPIWKFKTVGEAQERYNDADVDADAHDSSVMPAILISENVADHGEWETDDEFMFSTHIDNSTSTDGCSLNGGTIRSTYSNSSATGSTVTGFGSSTATLASAISASLTHHLFRNIGIFYSLTEPKLRAIIFDYDRINSSFYFAKHFEEPQKTATPPFVDIADDSGIGKSPPKSQFSPVPPPRTTSVTKTQSTASESVVIRKAPPVPIVNDNKVLIKPLLPDSVQAWKFLLLDVNYLEDEEDMIVSESEILRAQEIKEDLDTRQTQQLSILQRFKSASIGNLVDLPNEDDKKSIAERMRNKLQRGVFKLNMRSPKSEKKSRGIFRRAEATSLYLEDGMKPKYPIFGAPLEQLKLNLTTYPNVPRFVVDSVEFIERKDCIVQDGLYRASGNKVSVDELKQKLSESYIYDPKLLITDDIHTLTSLLKQFFRELGAPLIPQESYERFGRTLSDAAGIQSLRDALDDMREPNRSTLKFLIKHLTNVAACSSQNRMPASNLAIVWGPCILSANQIEFDIGRMNTLAKVLIENYEHIFNENERLVC